MASVEIVDVRKSYGDQAVIHGVSIPIANGEFVALVGPSGCGKTTLISLIAGTLKPDSGTVKIGVSSADGRGAIFNMVDAGEMFGEIAVLDGNFTNAAGDPYPELPDDEVGELERSYVYNDTVPLFYGHYWRRDEPVEHDDWTTYTACVDFSAGSGGTLVAYRWNGEPTITVANYVPHGAEFVAQTAAGSSDGLAAAGPRTARAPRGSC